MTHRTSHIANRKPGGFTLIEMLIVIGIILILIGILIPTISKVRIAVQTVSTRQMIGRLEAGINAYYSDFGAYPGPFSNTQLKTNSAGPSTVIGSATLAQAPVTSTENLYLALVGGLSITPAGGPVTAFTFNSNLSGGPVNLNPANIKRYNNYMSVTTDETTAQASSNPVQPSNGAGVWCVASGTMQGDTSIPEILDRYSTPSPILYMRANRGANGLAQYDAQTTIENVYCGVHDAQNASWDANASDYPSVLNSTGTTILNQGYQAYIGNAAVSAASSTATAANKDGFVLISAGPDGKYGTKDDITNFRQ